MAGVKFDKREPSAVIRMGLESVGAGRIWLQELFVVDAAWQS